MIVASEKNKCVSAKTLLSSINYEIVFQTSNGYEAIEKYEIVKPDILLLDLILSQSDGITVLKEIKKIYPESKIIIMTLLNDSKLLEQCYDSGALECFTIPFKFKDFLRLITSISDSTKITPKTITAIIE